jgi:ribonuclease HII
MIGIDEVGRGAWAGPLLVCAVRLEKPLPGLADSKKLSPSKRQQLASEIIANNPVGYGWVSADEIDDIGLTNALKLAATNALTEIYILNESIIIDGYVNLLPSLPSCQTQIKADETVAAVSAASIVAKVARDTRMLDYDANYPNYGFGRHVGYGTKQHADAIAKYGLCSIHRKSYKI